MQAARGTPVGDEPDGLDPADDSAAEPAATPSRRVLLVVFAAVALALYAADQVSKAVALAELDGRGDVPFIGTLLQLHLTRNPGAAFSTGTGFTPVLSVIALVAAVVVIWFARRLGSRGWAVALGFLMAGITGNLTDRIVRDPSPFHGHVIDFLRLPNWPIFNIADICINVAAGLIVILSFRGIRIDGTRLRDDVEADESGTDTGPDTGTDTHIDHDSDTADTTDEVGTRKAERS